MEVNLAAMENNARVLCDVCRQYGISVAGVIKFSDGDPRIAEAYAKGGCAQVAVSRAIHLKALKDALLEATRQSNEERQLLTYGVLACLKGLQEKGCNGPVTEAVKRFEKYLNQKAHEV